MLHAQPVDGLVREVVVEDVIRIAEVGLDRLCVLVEGRVPLIGISADEPVEVFEAETGRPQVEGAGLDIQSGTLCILPNQDVLYP